MNTLYLPEKPSAEDIKSFRDINCLSSQSAKSELNARYKAELKEGLLTGVYDLRNGCCDPSDHEDLLLDIVSELIKLI